MSLGAIVRRIINVDADKPGKFVLEIFKENPDFLCIPDTKNGKVVG